MGMVVSRIESRSLGCPAFRMAVIPRSDNARLIDFVKLRGTVDGSRRSAGCQSALYIRCALPAVGEAQSNSRACDTRSKLIDLDVVTPLSGVQRGQRPDWAGAHHDDLLLMMHYKGERTRPMEGVAQGRVYEAVIRGPVKYKYKQTNGTDRARRDWRKYIPRLGKVSLSLG